MAHQPYLFEDFAPENPPSQNGNNGRMTVAQVIEFFLAHSPGVCQRFAEDRQRVLRLFAKAHGALSLDEAKPYHLRLWVDEQKSWKSDWRKKGVIASVQRAFNFALRLGYIEKNPFVGVFQAPGDRGRPMTPLEFRSLFKATDNSLRRLLLFLWWTGARPGEARALKWPHIDTQRACARLLEHKTAHSRRDRHQRVIVLFPAVVKLLIWIRKNEPWEWVFTNSRGRPWTRSALDLRIYRLRKRLGIPNDCKLYSARHAFATRAARNGVELATLAQLLGHTSTRMSEWYLHLAGETDHLQAAARQANKK